MLNGFSLQEATVNQPITLPIVPAVVPSSPPQPRLSPVQQQPFRPAVPNPPVAVRPQQPVQIQQPQQPQQQQAQPQPQQAQTAPKPTVPFGLMGQNPAPNVTIRNTVPPMVAAEGGGRVRGPAPPRWPNQQQGQQTNPALQAAMAGQVAAQVQNQVGQQQQNVQQMQQPIQAQASGLAVNPNQMQQPIQNQMPQQQQPQVLQVQNQGPQIVNANTIPNQVVNQAQVQQGLQIPNQQGQFNIINPQQGIRQIGPNILNQGQGKFACYFIWLFLGMNDECLNGYMRSRFGP